MDTPRKRCLGSRRSQGLMLLSTFGKPWRTTLVAVTHFNIVLGVETNVILTGSIHSLGRHPRVSNTLSTLSLKSLGKSEKATCSQPWYEHQVSKLFAFLAILRQTVYARLETQRRRRTRMQTVIVCTRLSFSLGWLMKLEPSLEMILPFKNTSVDLES